MALSKTLSEAFERFWAAYPRRPDNPKAPAREVFARRVQGGAEPEAIVVAGERYARHVVTTGLDPKFIPHARTWLSQRRYEDHFPEAPASADQQPSPEPPHPLAHLRDQVGEDAWRSWIAPLQVEQDGDTLIITARTMFAAGEVQSRYGRLLPAGAIFRVGGLAQ